MIPRQVSWVPMFWYQYQKGLDISRCHDNAKYHDMTIPVSILCSLQLNRCSIVDSCTLHDRNKKEALYAVVSGDWATEYCIHSFIQQNRFVKKSSQNNWRVTTDISSVQMISSAVKQKVNVFFSNSAPNIAQPKKNLSCPPLPWQACGLTFHMHFL